MKLISRSWQKRDTHSKNHFGKFIGVKDLDDSSMTFSPYIFAPYLLYPFIWSPAYFFNR